APGNVLRTHGAGADQRRPVVFEALVDVVEIEARDPRLARLDGLDRARLADRRAEPRHGGRAVHVVLDVLGPRPDDLDGRPDLLGQGRGLDLRVGVVPPPEPAAGVGRVDDHLLRGDAEATAHDRLHVALRLAPRPDLEGVALPSR